MPMDEIEELKNITRKAIRGIPKTWHRLGLPSMQPYWQVFTNKELLQVNGLAILTGIIAGYAAIGFRYLIGFLQNAVMHERIGFDLVSPLNNPRGDWIFLILPAGLLISAYLTKWLASEATGHGVPEVIQSVMVRGGRMRKRIVGVKALASGVTIAAGGSVGREGPIVQIGAAAGSALGQILNLNPKLLKTLVGCGAAGAISATFNTPIAGVIFAIEIIILELKTKSFVPLVISSVFACVLARFYLGNEPAFFVPHYTLKQPSELIFYLGLGIVSGILGVAVIRTLYGIEDFFDNLKIPYFFKPILAGLIVAGIGKFYPEVFGVGYDTMSDVLQQKSEFALIAALIVLKTVAMSVTLAGGGSGGVFAPSLFIGAMVGGSYGYLAHQFFPDLTGSYGAYALVGMAALFSATSRATFTAIVILFEMTLDYSLILPLMFVCVMADQIAWALCKDSIYSLKLKRRGLSFVTDLGVNVMDVTLVKDIMTTEVMTASEDMTVEEAERKLLPSQHSVYPVVDKDGRLSGVITKSMIEQKLAKGRPRAQVGEVKAKAKTVVEPMDTVMSALKKISNIRDPRILVVDPKSKKLLGLVAPIDFVRLSHADSQEVS